MPWQGDAVLPVSDAHASKCSQPFDRASLWRHWARLERMRISGRIYQNQNGGGIIAQAAIWLWGMAAFFEILLEKVPCADGALEITAEGDRR